MKVGAPVADFIGAYLVVNSVFMGLYVRQTQGIGTSSTCSHWTGRSRAWRTFLTGHQQNEGVPEGPQGSGHPQLVHISGVRNQRDSHVVVGCLTRVWLALCDVLDAPRDLAGRARASRPTQTGSRIETTLIPIFDEHLPREPNRHPNGRAASTRKGVPVLRGSARCEGVVDNEQASSQRHDRHNRASGPSAP